jgi:hypothetical protein
MTGKTAVGDDGGGVLAGGLLEGEVVLWEGGVGVNDAVGEAVAERPLICETCQ